MPVKNVAWNIQYTLFAQSQFDLVRTEASGNA